MAHALVSRSKGSSTATAKPGRGNRLGRHAGPGGIGRGLGDLSGSPIAAAAPIPVLQTKLEIGAPNDRFEQEAERVADQVMRMPSSDGMAAAPAGGARRSVQRMCDECAEDEKVRLQRMPPPAAPRISALRASLAPRAVFPDQGAVLRRQGIGDDETLRRTAAGSGPDVTPGAKVGVHALRGRGRPLPATERAFFEPRFCHEFGRVRIHTDPQSADSARALNARAYTLGTHIVFGAGRYVPEIAAGRRLLAHELTHVVQQRSANGPPLVQRAPTYKTCEGKTELIGDAIAKAKPLAGSARQIFEDMFPTSSQKQAIIETFGEGWTRRLWRRSMAKWNRRSRAKHTNARLPVRKHRMTERLARGEIYREASLRSARGLSCRLAVRLH